MPSNVLPFKRKQPKRSPPPGPPSVVSIADINRHNAEFWQQDADDLASLEDKYHQQPVTKARPSVLNTPSLDTPLNELPKKRDQASEILEDVRTIRDQFARKDPLEAAVTAAQELHARHRDSRKNDIKHANEASHAVAVAKAFHAYRTWKKKYAAALGDMPEAQRLKRYVKGVKLNQRDRLRLRKLLTVAPKKPVKTLQIDRRGFVVWPPKK